MTRPISLETLKDLNTGNFMLGCCYKGCGKIPQWNHVLCFAGRQIDEAWNIVPACKFHHDQATAHNPNYKKEVENYFTWVALSRAKKEQIAKYSKVENLAAKLSRLNEKFGKFPGEIT